MAATRVCASGCTLVTGDDAVLVSVKTGLSRYSARQIPPMKARQRIEDGARQALSRVQKGRVCDPGSPCTITIEVETVEKMGQFRSKEGIEVVEPLKVKSHGKNWLEAWDRIWPQADL